MLSELYIRNLTLIEELSLFFGGGLTVLTGETGAGKSIVLDAIFLVIGGRMSADHIRDGAKEVDVTARFTLDLKAMDLVNQALMALDMPVLEDPSLLVRRIVSRSGRHRQYINGVPVTVSHLREIAEPLIDFTGQHAQHALLAPKGQLTLLDLFASHDQLLTQMARAHEERKALLLQKQQLDLDERTRVNRMDWLRFQIDEIEKCAPKVGEIDALLQERERLLNVAKIREEGARIIRALSDGDEGDDVCSRLAAANRAIQTLTRFNPIFESLEVQLRDVDSVVNDVCLQVARYVRAADEDPERLQIVEDRIGDIKQLLRKHADTVEELLELQTKMQAELSALQESEERLQALEQKLEAANAQVRKAAKELFLSRVNAGEKLAPAVVKEIADLGMAEAIFKVELKQNDGDLALSATALGADSLRLLFSANKGESANPVEKVASGGELSRVMLAIKRVLMKKNATMVSIFDEVDAGVGGAIGHAIGEKLKAISRGCQVLCVTHLAQVAALADAHLKVEKKVTDGRTLSTFKALNKSERIEELARMMGGKKVTELTRRHANEFLDQAGVPE